jgi:HNH endonuclease
MMPFNYPAEPHRRRHGPAGYFTLESFRPWLRDEFAYRCVYCLRREQWEPGRARFEIDHWASVRDTPELARVYDNLLYTCDVCNSVKGARNLPDPCTALLAENLNLDVDGRITGHTDDARWIIRILGLDDAEFVAFRARWIKIVALAKVHDPDLYRQLLGYPDDLPNLSLLRPPGGNTRPEGIVASCHEQRARGELPATY